MEPFSSPEDAKSFIVQKVLEQAASEGISFTEFELKLFGYTPDSHTVTEEELERSEDLEDKFWDKVIPLVKAAQHKEREFRGRVGKKEFRRALQLAARNRDYFSSILDFGGFAKSPLPPRPSRDWVYLIGTGLLLFALLMAAIIYGEQLESWYSRYLENSWFAQHLVVPVFEFIDRNFAALFAVFVLGSFLLAFLPRLIARLRHPHD